jgi:hypothetical protein
VFFQATATIDQFTLDNDYNFSAIYEIPSGAATVSFNSQNTSAGVPLSVTTDRNGLGGSTTPFCRLYDKWSWVGVTAPQTQGAYSFEEWRVDNQFAGRITTTSLQAFNGNVVTAVYLTSDGDRTLSMESKEG